MRLDRLDLIRYGRFSDTQITLPQPSGDTPDVTIIYGPNEAGKSTAFTAYLELLFGMKARDHPYDFRFKRSDLLVGAQLSLPSQGQVVLHRNSKRNQSLLDDQGRPVDESVLAAALHGLDRDHYVERFSLNDEGLRKGGARIAGAQGDLGQLLHAGVSGLTNIASALDHMTTQADRFHKKGGRGTALKLGKTRLTEIGQDLRAKSLTPEREQALAETKTKAKAVYDAADTALADQRRREAASKAAQIWYRETEDIRLIEHRLAEFPDGPDLRKGAAEQVASLVATLTEKTARLDEAQDTIAKLAQTIAQNPADPVADDIANELAHLDTLKIGGASLMARATTAKSDLGNRIKERDALADEITKTLAALSCPDAPVASLVLAPNELEALAKAAQAVVTAHNAVDAAQAAAAEAQDRHSPAPPEPQDLSDLNIAWDQWQSVADLTAAQTSVAAEGARLASAVAGLPKNWPALIDAGLPARETLLEVTQSLPIAAAQIAAARTDLDKCEAQYQLAQSKRIADEAAPSAVDIDMMARARRLRDEKWQAHRGSLSEHTADAFETALHHDDDTQAGYAVGAEARAQLATARRDEQAALVLCQSAQNRLDQTTEEHHRLSAQAATLAAQLGLPENTAASALADRYTALVQAAQISAQLDNAQADLNRQQQNRKDGLADLVAAAQLVGIDGVDKAVPPRVRAALTLQDSVRQTWMQWTRANDAIADLNARAKEEETAKDAADQSLATLTAALPLASHTAQDILSALPHLRILQGLHGNLMSLSSRIEALQDALLQLDTSAARISAMTGEDPDQNADPLDVIDAARTRVLEADRATQRRTLAQDSTAAEAKVQKAGAAAIEAAEAELGDWFKDQGAADLPPTARVAHLVERDSLRATLRAHDKTRNDARAGAKPEFFEEECALLPDASRAAAVQQLLSDAQEARDLARDALREATRLYDQAFDADDLSDLATEQATLREELRSGARRAAVARLGVLAAKGALRRLAQERRTTMLRDVEQAFVAITAPAWTSVDVWSQTEGEKLVGIQPDGSAVPVEMMSTGTMGQLYFALRVAGYRSFASTLGPLPMVLDDIMETFDDVRAKAALHLCADIGRSGQAIIFTHHAHLVDLARASIAGVNIVDMPK